MGGGGEEGEGFGPAVDDGFVGVESVEGEGSDVGGYVGLRCCCCCCCWLWWSSREEGGGGGMFGEGEALGDEVVVYEGEGAGGEEVGGDVEVAGVSGAAGEGGGGEAMGWDVEGEGGGEDGGVGRGERWGFFVLVGVVGAVTLPGEGEGEGRSEACGEPQEWVQWPRGSSHNFIEALPYL